MRRGKVPKRGRWFWIVVAGFVGFLIGDRHAVTWQMSAVSASQSVALRFPEPGGDSTGSETVAVAQPMPVLTAPSAAVKDAQLALLNPEPMVPLPAPHVAPSTQPPTQAAAHAAAPAAASREAKAPSALRPHPEAKSADVKSAVAEAAASHASRPGFMLNDAQIASIKQRLHLTADQEAMWPAVEAALRNVAYARSRDGRRHGAPDNAAQLASADPDSIEVQGLKSAAIPLIMSFSDQQKNEVRSLAHVMGLDKLANEF
jgi:hypothetical protein